MSVRTRWFLTNALLRALYTGVATLMLWSAGVANASTLSPTAKQEIQGLLMRLEQSGCEFERNGSWFPAREARAHLQTKFEWLEQKGMIKSAEDYIAKGATTSSASGKAYRVRCGEKVPVPSANWLTAVLADIRTPPRHHD